MQLAFRFYLLVTTGYLVDTGGYLVVTSGYFLLLLVPRFSNNDNLGCEHTKKKKNFFCKKRSQEMHCFTSKTSKYFYSLEAQRVDVCSTCNFLVFTL